MDRLIIIGANGLIGSYLLNSKWLDQFDRFGVQRRSSRSKNIHVWNPEAGDFPEEILTENCHIINLAGANIAGKRWTKSRKREIIASRVQANQALEAALSRFGRKVRTIFSASAIGYYGTSVPDALFTEQMEHGSDFLSDVCEQWEESANRLRKYAQYHYIFRFGVVFAQGGGILQKMARPVSYTFGQPLGSGNQIVPWIAIDDVARMISFFIENKPGQGVYNAIAGNITNRDLTKDLSITLGRPFVNLPIPAFILQLFLGELSQMLLQGNSVSNEKLLQTGFSISIRSATEAMQSYLNNRVE